MQLLNNTPFLAGYTVGMDPDGRESVVVVIKASYSIPASGRAPPELLDQQMALVEADIYSGEPGLSAPLYESDYALMKPHCDITIVGSAYAPDGKPAERVQAGFKVGKTSKLIDVLGTRHWIAQGSDVTITRPQDFQVRPITYEIAFGGTDKAHDDERYHATFMPNPVGIGFHRAMEEQLIDGTLAPSTEVPGQPIAQPNGPYRPMALGVVGRGWEPRIQYGGTYDDAWLDECFPFLPKDFDNRFHQSAPHDQQSPYLRGGEEVRLVNLTPEGQCRFQIPTVEIPLSFFRRKSERAESQAVLDTLVMEPDQARFTLTWRSSMPLRRNIFELSEVRIGKVSQGQWQTRDRGDDSPSSDVDSPVSVKPDDGNS